MRVLPGSEWAPSHRVLMCLKGLGISFIKATNPICEGSTLMTESLFTGLPPNAIHLGVRISTCEFWGNVLCSVAQSLCDPMDCSLPGFSVPEIIPARILECAIKKKKNTGVDCHFPLQEIFHTQGSNPSLLWLLHWLAVSLPLRHLGEIQPCLFSMKLKTSNQLVALAISQLDQEGTCFQARYSISFPALLMYN